MVTGKNDVTHEGIYLVVFDVFTGLYIPILAGYSKVNHENITADPVDSLREHQLNGPNLPASLLYDLKGLELLLTTDKFIGSVRLVWLNQDVVWFDVQMKVPNTVEFPDRFNQQNAYFQDVHLS